MAKRKKQSATEKEYYKQRKRIKQFIRQAEKRGFIFSDAVISDKPKRITKSSVSHLSKITPEKLYKKASYASELSYGEIVSGKKGLTLEREARKQRRKNKYPETTQEPTNTPEFNPPYNISDDATFFDQVVLSTWYGQLEANANGEAYHLLRAWMNDTIRENGMHDTAIMLEKATDAGNLLTWETVYKTGIATQYIANLIDYLPDQGILYKEQTLDKIDFMKKLGDALEQTETWERPF